MALQTASAANALRSQNDGNISFRASLLGYASEVNRSKFDIKSAIPLVKKIIAGASDVEIWRAVSELITLTSSKPLTLPTAWGGAVFSTPLRPNSSSQIGIEQTHTEVHQRILEELVGRVYDNVGGFYERYFEGKAWTKKATDIYQKARSQLVKESWSGWPNPSEQGAFFEWFMKFQGTLLNGLDRSYYTSANKVLIGSEADRKLDLFLTAVDAVLLDGDHDWSNVLVIGEHKQNPSEDCSIKTLVQLTGYAREVFGSQPERRFVPGFTICGSLMRLWMFDRSGLYNSEKFDIHDKPEQFVTVVAGYALMTKAELGLSTFVKLDGNSRYIDTKDEKIILEDRPIASTKAIACRGTTCYRGRRNNSTEWEFVVKFAWPSVKRQREGELLKRAKETGVTGVAVWFNHEQIITSGYPDTISHFRRNMKFGTPRELPRNTLWVDDSLESSRARSKSSIRGRSRGSAARTIGLRISTKDTTISSLGRKRKSDTRLDRGSGPKRSKSDSSHTSATNLHIKEGELSAQDIQEPGDDSLAFGRKEWERKYGNRSQAGRDNLANSEDETYDNRVYYCLVTSPAGQPLYTCQSSKELLEVLRDAIRGHKSLYQEGKILHRDISENNIIILRATATEGGPKGMLIDLDLAKELESKASRARHRTGTMQFMAIGVLEGESHTYRHDLESFFYVFLWVCIRYDYDDKLKRNKWENAEAKRRLQGWYVGRYTEIAGCKLGDIAKKNRFDSAILAGFAPRFENLKQLALDLRAILFPIIDGEIFTSTPVDHNIMYDGMINAFIGAIDSLGKEK